MRRCQGVAFRCDIGDKRTVKQREVAERMRRDGTEAVACPFPRIVADVAAIGLELVVVGDDDFPEVGLPEAVDAEVADFAGRLHLAVDRGREGLELADDFPEVHLVVRRTVFDLDDEVDVIGHDDILVELHFGIEPRHVGDGPSDTPAEFVQRDAFAGDCAEDRLVLRDIERDEEPSPSVVDRLAAKRLAENALPSWLPSHAHS